MTWNCQRKQNHTGFIYTTHMVEAPDEATARIMMFNRSGGARAWLDPDKTNVWSAEEWIAI